MYNNVSGCYYHPNKLSVAVCSECGHGLCRDCDIDCAADYYGIKVCED